MRYYVKRAENSDLKLITRTRTVCECVCVIYSRHNAPWETPPVNADIVVWWFAIRADHQGS